MKKIRNIQKEETSKIFAIGQLTKAEQDRLYSRAFARLLLDRGEKNAGKLEGVLEESFKSPEDQLFLDKLLSTDFLRKNNGQYVWTEKAENIYLASLNLLASFYAEKREWN